MTSAQAMAQRYANAEARFIGVVMATIRCSEADAVAVLKLYRKHKIAKTDVGIGQIQVKHGAFLEADALRNAVRMAKAKN